MGGCAREPLGGFDSSRVGFGFIVGDRFEGDCAGWYALLDRQGVPASRGGDDTSPFELGVVETSRVDIDADNGVVGSTLEVAVDLAHNIWVFVHDLLCVRTEEGDI